MHEILSGEQNTNFWGEIANKIACATLVTDKENFHSIQQQQILQINYNFYLLLYQESKIHKDKILTFCCIRIMTVKYREIYHKSKENHEITSLPCFCIRHFVVNGIRRNTECGQMYIMLLRIVCVSSTLCCQLFSNLFSQE